MVMKNIKKLGFFALSFFIAVGSLGDHAIAQTATAEKPAEQKTKPPLPRWIVASSNRATPANLACVMTQTISTTSGNNRRRILLASIRKQSENESIVFTLPHGLNFKNGVGFAIDDEKSVRSDFQSADTNGSYASIPLTAERLKALKSGNLMKVIITGSNGRNINIELTLNGFTQAYDLMK